MKTLFLKGLSFYQRFVSPILSLHFGINCRYYPSCSEYAKRVILNQGVLKGGFLALRRFLKCNPLFPGGVDLPPEKDFLEEKKHG
ncbi:MAG: membrane protein insertion efficiency factor YidD [Caldimicrobium sp.]